MNQFSILLKKKLLIHVVINQNLEIEKKNDEMIFEKMF